MNELYKTFLDASKDCMVITNEFGTIVELNKQAILKFEKTEQNPKGKNFQDLLTRLSLESSSSALPDSYTLNVINNTQQTERLKHITESNIDLLKQMIDSSIGAFLIFHENIVQDVNESALSIFGYEYKEEMIGLKISDFFTDDIISFDEIIEMVFLNKQGERIDVFVKEREITYEGILLKVISVVDITKLIDREKFKIKKTKYEQRSQMIDMLAHQWRQPLGAMSVALASLKFDNIMDRYDKSKFSRIIDDLSKKMVQLSNTIEEFRLFFHEDRRPMIDYIKETISKAIKISESIIDKSVEVNIHGENVLINTYHNELVHVFSNLFKNSYEAFINNNIANPKIEIDIVEENGLLKIVFTDNGGGIDKNIIDKIFDPYFTTKSDLNGSGLGLYVSIIVIQEHCKGTIEVKSQDENTQFFITIKGY